MPTLNDVATLAFEQGKTSRRDAWEALQRMISRSSALDSAAHSDLAALYSFFTPPKPKQPKNDFDWVARAAARPKCIRPYLQLLYARNGVLYATDGYRLHYAPTTLADGYYDTNGQSVACSDKYPDVVHTAASTDNDWLLCDDHEIIPRSLSGKPNNLLKGADGVHLAEDYFRDATLLEGTECAGYRHPKHELREGRVSLRFKGGRGAVIMYVRHLGA